jgi:hypothetical protein
MFVRRIKTKKEREKIKKKLKKISLQPALLLSRTEPRLHNLFVSGFRLPP